MDCSPEYVVGYYSEDEEEKQDEIVKETGDDEKRKEVKDVVCQQQHDEMEKKLLEEKSTTTITNFSTNFPFINQLKSKQAELKRLFCAKKRWEQKLKNQIKAEEDYERVMEDRRENIVPSLIKETKINKERIEELKKHIQSVKFDICEELKATESKINSVRILTELYEHYKVYMIYNFLIFFNIFYFLTKSLPVNMVILKRSTKYHY